MPSPFENIVIGNFLYGLGLAMGHQPQVVEGCISLLQQTPLDRPLGDVLVHYPGAVCLLEFKREEANWTKERAKLEVLRAALKNRPHLEAVSRDIHRFVRIDRFSTATHPRHRTAYGAATSPTSPPTRAGCIWPR